MAVKHEIDSIDVDAEKHSLLVHDMDEQKVQDLDNIKPAPTPPPRPLTPIEQNIVCSFYVLITAIPFITALVFWAKGFTLCKDKIDTRVAVSIIGGSLSH